MRVGLIGLLFWIILAGLHSGILTGLLIGLLIGLLCGLLTGLLLCPAFQGGGFPLVRGILAVYDKLKSLSL
jgi:hypothetical protein